MATGYQAASCLSLILKMMILNSNFFFLICQAPNVFITHYCSLAYGNGVHILHTFHSLLDHFGWVYAQ